MTDPHVIKALSDSLEIDMLRDDVVSAAIDVVNESPWCVINHPALWEAVEKLWEAEARFNEREQSE